MTMKTELHLHTSEVSSCGHVCAADAVSAYHERGYSCLVVTDHFSPYFIAKCKNKGITNIKDEYLKGYNAALEQGQRLGMTVLLGSEVCLYEASNDYLVYGISPEEFNDDSILRMSVSDFSKYCKEKGYLLYQAHPFRNHMKVVKPELLFGIEVNNGNPRHNSRNNISLLWAEQHGLRKISGSDYHQTEDLARGGIITEKPITSNLELLTILTENKYSLITI